MARSMGDARDGIKEAADAFALLGITSDMLVGPSGNLIEIDQVLPMIANGLRDISSQADRMDVAQALLGRGGTKLLPALQKGEEGLRSMRMEMQRYGGAMSAGFSEASASFVDSTTNLQNATARLKEALSEPFMGPFTSAINTLAESIGKLNVMEGGWRERAKGYGTKEAFEEMLGRGNANGSPTGGGGPFGFLNMGISGPKNRSAPWEFSGSSMDQRHLDQMYARDHNTLGSFGGEGMIMDSPDIGAMTSGMDQALQQTTNQAQMFAASFAANIASGLTNALFSAQNFGDAFAAILQSALSMGASGLIGNLVGGLFGGGKSMATSGTKAMPGPITLAGAGAGSAAGSKAYSRGFV